MKIIYIAGPYTKGDPVINTRKAITAGEALAHAGYYPYIPHLSLFWHLIFPHDAQFWYEYDNVFLLKCDAVLRLEGESTGADNEVALATKNNIPVYFSIRDLIYCQKSPLPPQNEIDD